jgi:hypothetical protein
MLLCDMFVYSIPSYLMCAPSMCPISIGLSPTSQTKKKSKTLMAADEVDRSNPYPALSGAARALG